jgi:predicted amidohydrolase
VLPELWTVGFHCKDNFHSSSEKIGGKTTEILSDLARDKNSYLFSGSMIEEDNDNYYNTALLFDRKGNIIAQYRKIHLFASERHYVTRGHKIAVANTEFGKFGLSICYDIRFPEMYRSLIENGAETIVSCAAWSYPSVEHWNMLNQTRAIENQVNWLTSSCAGSSGGKNFIGRSMMLDPWGTFVCGSYDKPCVLQAELEPEKTAEIRECFSAVKDIVSFS